MNNADIAWMLVATALVLLMTPALAFFYGGLVRSKNALNTMMMSFVALGPVAVVWALLGYSLAFAPGSPAIGSLAFAGLRGVGLEAQGAIPHLLFMCFQGTFAIITPALISGAVVERMRFNAYLAFILVWVLAVYAPVAHWVWGGGFLAAMGALDFAGGAVVHVNAAAAALVAAMVIGTLSAIAMGAIGAFPSYFALIYRAKTKLDDSLDVVAAHGLGGATGAILTGVFAEAAWSGGPNGLIGGNPGQVLTQAASVVMVLAYSGTATFVILKLLALVMPLRIGVRDEGVGVDVTDHGEEAYTHGDGAILVKPKTASLTGTAVDALAMQGGGRA